jgi:hypothetical protein
VADFMKNVNNKFEWIMFLTHLNDLNRWEILLIFNFKRKKSQKYLIDENMPIAVPTTNSVSIKPTKYKSATIFKSMSLDATSSHSIVSTKDTVELLLIIDLFLA